VPKTVHTLLSLEQTIWSQCIWFLGRVLNFDKSHIQAAELWSFKWRIILKSRVAMWVKWNIQCDLHLIFYRLCSFTEHLREMVFVSYYYCFFFKDSATKIYHSDRKFKASLQYCTLQLQGQVPALMWNLGIMAIRVVSFLTPGASLCVCSYFSVFVPLDFWDLQNDYMWTWKGSWRALP
jgi:hypothetical protein